KKKLEQKLWAIANALRGKMDGAEFRKYILGFIFYKYLSEKLELFANGALEGDGVLFADLDESEAGDIEILEAVKAQAVEQLGYYLKPSELFPVLARRGQDGKFIMDEIQ